MLSPYVAELSVQSTSTLLNARSTLAQNQASLNSSTTNAGSMQGKDYSKMGGMNHGMDLEPANAEFDLRFIDGMTHHQRDRYGE